MGTDTAYRIRLYTQGLVLSLYIDTCKTPLAKDKSQNTDFYLFLLIHGVI